MTANTDAAPPLTEQNMKLTLSLVSLLALAACNVPLVPLI